MSKHVLLSGLMLACATFCGAASAADEPTLHQVYQAADAGRLSDAQAMMDKVLRDHPNSAKAHFVEAELLAKQGRLANAEAELGTAQRLAPGLPFAKPQAVQNLTARITASHHTAPTAHAVAAEPAGGMPWGMMLGGLGLVAAVIFFIRTMSRRNANILPGGRGPGYGYGPGAPLQPYGAGGVAQPMPTAAGGIGSGILGGLATGAAVGAGMVAGEALMHHFTDGNRHEASPPPTAPSWDAASDDMGGSDFGVSDGSSWDDGTGGGDWN
jgi:hypothetical protein